MKTVRQKVIDIFATFATDREDLSINYREPVTQEDIDRAQAKCNVIFPDDLKDFWLTCGSGTMCSSKDKVLSENNNFFLGPDIVEKVLNRNAEAGYEELEINKGFIPLFVMSEESYWGIKEEGSGDHRIYGYIVNGETPEITSENIWEFAIKFWHDPDWLLSVNWSFLELED